jgi:hypothetical protein
MIPRLGQPRFGNGTPIPSPLRLLGLSETTMIPGCSQTKFDLVVLVDLAIEVINGDDSTRCLRQEPAFIG